MHSRPADEDPIGLFYMLCLYFFFNYFRFHCIVGKNTILDRRYRKIVKIFLK